jgi:hypothetical protein
MGEAIRHVDENQKKQRKCLAAHTIRRLTWRTSMTDCRAEPSLLPTGLVTSTFGANFETLQPQNLSKSEASMVSL